MENIILDINKVFARYKKKDGYVLKDVSLKVYDGDIHGFVGPNGAGKTTLIKLIIGGFKQIKGDIKICDTKNTSIKGKKLLGYVPEKAQFIKGLKETTKNYLIDIALMKGLSKKEALTRIDSLSKDLEISKKMLRSQPYKFSSGQKKRVLIAQSLLSFPRLLILDEPVANLDPKSRSQVLLLLKKLNKKYNTTIFISSHILSELQQFITSLTIINNGEIVLNRFFKTKKVNKKIYEIISPNFQKLICLIKNFSFEIDKNKSLYIKINSETELNLLKDIIIKNKILVTSFADISFDIHKLYNKHVFMKH